MLGAVTFGHEGFQPVIEAIIELAEHVRQGAAGTCAAGAGSGQASAEVRSTTVSCAELADAYPRRVKQDRYAKVGEVKKGRQSLCRRRCRRPNCVGRGA